MTRLVLLPGLDGTGEMFAPLIRALDGIPTQVVAYPPDRAMDYDEHEAYARARLPDDEDFVLLAESFSGPVGIALAASRPNRLKGLILCASFAANPLPLFGPLRRWMGMLPAAHIPPALMAPWLYAGRSTPELRRAHAAAMARVFAPVIRARVTAILGVDQRALLPRIAVPVMYMRARRDRMVPESAGRAILALRPDVELTEFDAQHFLLQTEPEACSSAIIDFLRRHVQ